MRRAFHTELFQISVPTNRHKINTSAFKNAFYSNGIRDSEGKMISGTLNLNVSLAADASIPVKVLDKLIALGKTETVSYQVETPGVIDIKVIPTQPGKEGLANVQIKFEVQ